MDKMKAPALMKKGAEANLYVTEWYGRKIVLKKRFSKKYRHPQLDAQIRNYRTVHEPQLMHQAKIAGVPTPAIFFVNLKESTIVMEYIEGRQVKRVLNEISPHERHAVCFRIGQLTARLHQHGIIHGDLTTSNMIMGSHGKIHFVDFGLGERTTEIEARGVDLHLVKRALESAHFLFSEQCFGSIMKGYSEVLGKPNARNVLDKIAEIERRGRYVDERRRE